MKGKITIFSSILLMLKFFFEKWKKNKNRKWAEYDLSNMAAVIILSKRSPITWSFSVFVSASLPLCHMTGERLDSSLKYNPVVMYTYCYEHALQGNLSC